MDIITKCVNAQVLACRLTGLITATLSASDMDRYDKACLLGELIKQHETNPLDSSAEWVEQWKEEFKDLIIPTMTLEESEALPF